MISLKNNTLQVTNLGQKSKTHFVYIRNFFQPEINPNWSQFLYPYFSFYDCHAHISTSFLHKSPFPLKTILDDFAQLMLVLNLDIILVSESIMCPVAMQLALMEPQKIRALILISPNLPVDSRQKSNQYLNPGLWKWLTSAEPTANEKKWQAMRYRFDFYRNYYKKAEYTFLQKIPTRSYIFFSFLQRQYLFHGKHISQLFPKSMIYNLDCSSDQLKEDKRFQKILYTVFKKEQRKLIAG